MAAYKLEEDIMDNRYIGAIFLIPLVVFLFLGGEYLKYASMVIALLGTYEYYKVTKIKGFHPVEILGYLIAIIYYFCLGLTFNFNILSAIIVLVTIIMLSIPVINTKYTYVDCAVTLLGFIYITVFSGFIYLISIKKYGNMLVWLVFISSWATDITAYYIGKNFGKKKLCPKISPKKTVAGSVGGFLGSVIFCSIIGYVFIISKIPIKFIHYIFIGAMCGITCQFGDLVASSIKRYSGVKDFSHLIPGHGGILDRFDSILFSSVTIYFYIILILHM